MKNILYSVFTLLSCALLHLSCGKPTGKNPVSHTTDLEDGFKNPTGKARAKVYWWWMNGYTDSVRIKEELLAIKNAGLGGVDIFEIGFRPDGVVPSGPPFMSDASLKHVLLAINEATRLGLEVGLNLSSSWNAGGTWITPEHGAKSLYFTKKRVNGSSEVSLPISDILKKNDNGKVPAVHIRADGKPAYQKEVAVLAIPVRTEEKLLDTTTIVDVTAYFDPIREVLNWNVPAGSWDIYRYVCVSTGEQLKLPSPGSRGLIIDHFDSIATRVHFEYFIQKLKPLLGDFTKTSLKNLYLASFEATGTIWTPSLPTEFKKMHGYDVSKLLPALFDKEIFGTKISQEFKSDFELTVSELMINNHYRKGKEIANQYGLALISESGGPGPPLHNVPVEGIKALGALDVPRGEFWINHSRFDHQPDSVDLLMLVKEVSAASHIYQRKITELEAFTSFQNWQEGPGDMKPVGDRAFCEGMSRPVIHGFSHNPNGVGYPGIYYAAGTHFNDKTTWWPKVKPFNDYLARVSHIMQQTDFVADVLYYYGDKTPNFVTPKNTRFAAGSGYDYEIINTEILLRDLTVKNGLLTLPYGAQFKVLALGEISSEDPALLKKLESLLRDGAVITGKFPSALNGKNKELAQKIWYDVKPNAPGKKTGRKIFTTPSGDILKRMKVGPDFDYPDKQSARLDYMHDDRPVLDYIHQKKGDLDFYFVRNTSAEWVTRLCTFRQTERTPQLWNPVTGHIITLPVYNHTEQGTAIPLSFPPFGSFFIIFKNKTPGDHYTALTGPSKPEIEYTENGILLHQDGSYEFAGRATTKIEANRQVFSLTGPWNISFTKGWGAPETAIFPELISWTQSSDEGIRHYLGSGIYRKEFTYGPKAGENERVFLDLGDVYRVAEAWLNGKSLGIVWTKTYRFDVTEALKEGQNELRVEVVNTWSNRIIGDITSTKKYTKTNLNVRGSRELSWTETPLLPSGIIGPVQIKTVRIFK
jgi:hypothetical protein